jgi:ABC-type transporter Mla subunit MlaD
LIIFTPWISTLELLEAIKSDVPEEFTQNLSEEEEPHHQIFTILNRIIQKGRAAEDAILKLNTESAALQTKINRLTGELEAGRKAGAAAEAADPAIIAERDNLQAELKKEQAALAGVKDSTSRTEEKEACEKAATAATTAAAARRRPLRHVLLSWRRG